MTNKERLLAFLGFQPPENAADAALLDKEITGNDDYVADTLPSIRLAAISLIEIILTTPDTSNSTTGYSINYDRNALLKRLELLKTDAGLLTGPTIKAVNFW